jgi:hypothetical protein
LHSNLTRPQRARPAPSTPTHTPQGEGGIFHNDTFKQRYFVLARVPHATVLIYYGQKCMDEDHILGYIDLRRVTSVRETTKMVVMDNNKSPASAMINRFKGLVGVAPPAEGTPRPVIELVTSSRTFVLSAATIVMPQPMTTSMAVGADVITKPLYLFGWPFPVPPMDDEADEVRGAVAAAAVEAARHSGGQRWAPPELALQSPHRSLLPPTPSPRPP